MKLIPVLLSPFAFAFALGCTASDPPGVASGSGGAAGAPVDAGGSGGQTGTGGAAGAGAGTGGALATQCGWGAPVFSTMAPSTMPPGGLDIENVPQFVSIGFDDNAYEDGMQWILDFMKSKVNPGAGGNPCNFDGAPARATFFINSHVGITPDALKALHGRAYSDGHEVANHTDTHGDALMQNPDKAVWTREITTCNDYLTGLGVPRDQIIGFRTPFLQQSEATFQAIVEQKFRYDCSIEHYYGMGGFDWPYTLDGGRDTTHAYQGLPAGKYPALWELPVNELMTAATGWQAVTGFDYNFWIAKKMAKQAVVDMLMANLEIRLQGGNYPANRAPLLIGGHTDLYSHANANANMAATAPVADRRAAIEEFIDRALAYHPAVRIVPFAAVLRWMQNPVGLDGSKGQ